MIFDHDRKPPRQHPVLPQVEEPTPLLREWMQEAARTDGTITASYPDSTATTWVISGRPRFSTHARRAMD